MVLPSISSGFALSMSETTICYRYGIELPSTPTFPGAAYVRELSGPSLPPTIPARRCVAAGFR